MAFVFDGTSIENPATAYKMELYDVQHDWTQYSDVAAANPDKVKEMTDLMFGEFAKYQVLPIDASAIPRWVSARPSLTAGRKVFTYLKPVFTYNLLGLNRVRWEGPGARARSAHDRLRLQV